MFIINLIVVIFFPILIVLFVVGIYLQNKLKRRLLEKERDFCKSILLTGSVFTDSPKSSWNLVKLIMFQTNVDKISDDIVIALMKKVRIIGYFYCFIFMFLFSFFIFKVLEGK